MAILMPVFKNGRWYKPQHRSSWARVDFESDASLRAATAFQDRFLGQLTEQSSEDAGLCQRISRMADVRTKPPLARGQQSAAN